MELFKYIVKFIYRIRWWMVLFPCMAGIIAWFLTRNLEKTYDVKTTIFTGIISGYNVDATDTRNATPLCHALFFQQQYRCPMKVPLPATHRCHTTHHRNS